MQVKLKVLGGKSDGREITIPGPKFLIGRGDQCHLRPRSDAISRNHCVIMIGDSKVTVRDLGSKNGTYINEELIDGDCEVKTGSRLRVGRLEFEILVDMGLAGAKRPVVKGVKEAAARAAESRASDSKFEDSDISVWLDEADEAERVRRLSDPDTRQFRLDETDQIALTSTTEEETANATGDKNAEEAPDKKKGKKKYGKLPEKPKQKAENSKAAAEETLKKFFNRR